MLIGIYFLYSIEINSTISTLFFAILENFWDKFPCFQLVFTAMQVVVDFHYRIAQCVNPAATKNIPPGLSRLKRRIPADGFYTLFNI